MEVIINQRYETFEVEIYLKEKHGHRTVIYGYNGKSLIEQTIETNEPSPNKIKPFMVVPMDFFKVMSIAFAKKLNEDGVNTENENMILGRLDATKYHLEDMRKAFEALVGIHNKIE